MFGTKFKAWMENHIGRSRKKSQQEKIKCTQNGGRGVMLESSESLAQSDTGISSGSQQILSSSATDNKEGGYCTTTMESERSGMTHCLTAVSLPSPESAYSTGYSTDGASPGGTGPPEYYINIRTGKHYFPSPAPTPTSPQPNMTFGQLHSGNQFFATSFLTPHDFCLPPAVPVGSSSRQGSSLLRTDYLTATPPCVRSRLSSASSLPWRTSNGFSSALSAFVPEPQHQVTRSDGKHGSHLSTSVPTNFDAFKSPCIKSPPKSQLNSFKLFLKSPKQDKRKEKGDISKTPSLENKKKILSPTKTKKWYMQPFQKFGQKRTEPCESTLKPETKSDVLLDKNIYYLTKENAASPRQRNRIKTNPWLPTEPMSQNFHNFQINFTGGVPRNRSCTNTPLQNRKMSDVENVQNRIKEINVRYEESKDYLANLEKVVGRHIGQKLFLELSDHSEEDLTLNEMMGTYNESYVYEKETDILSDSDPTDCEDYVSDSEADNGGDEQDSHDDELDFIDNGSITESDSNFPGNTGKCTYHDTYVKKNSFPYKVDRHHPRKDGEAGRKSFRRDKDPKGRKSKEDKKRKPIRKSFRCEGEGEPKRKSEEIGRPKVELNENIGGLNLGRVLMERMMARNGSKSADGTPVTIRRQNLIKELRETHIGVDPDKIDQKKRKSTLNGDLLLVDVEGDRKYNELIREAENIFQSMQNSPVIQNRKKMNLAENQKSENKKILESADIWKKAEQMCCPNYSIPERDAVRKSPKHLGLKLSMDETPKNLKKLEFEKDRKGLFKAKPSAHSPLDPLGPTFRNFSVFKPVNIDDDKISISSSENSEPTRKLRSKPSEPVCTPVVAAGPKYMVPESPIVPIAFQSIDLGKPLTSYCPQSEPVKRKIYTCSKTYDKLVKTFENPAKIFDETENGRVRHGSLMVKRRPQENSKVTGNRDALRDSSLRDKARLAGKGRDQQHQGRGNPKRDPSTHDFQRRSFDADAFT